MQDFEFDISVRGTLKAYSEEDAKDQLGNFLKELTGYDSYMQHVEALGIRFNIPSLVKAGVIGEPAGSAAKELITRKDLLHLLTEQEEDHKIPSWRYYGSMSEINTQSHGLTLQAALADVDHRQWQHWSHGIAPILTEAMLLLQPSLFARSKMVTGIGRKTFREEQREMAAKILERLERWKILWQTPFYNLTEEEKKADFEWADQSIEIIKNHLASGWPRG